jgi:hypothetical protein
MKRSPQWYRDQSAKAQREYQRVVWGHVAPETPARPGAAQTLYPGLASRGAAQPEQQTKAAPAKSTAASRVWPNLARGRP